MKKKKKHMAELISKLSKYVETVVNKIESCATDYKKQIEEIGKTLKKFAQKLTK